MSTEPLEYMVPIGSYGDQRSSMALSASSSLMHSFCKVEIGRSFDRPMSDDVSVIKMCRFYAFATVFQTMEGGL